MSSECKDWQLAISEGEYYELLIVIDPKADITNAPSKSWAQSAPSAHAIPMKNPDQQSSIRVVFRIIPTNSVGIMN